MSQRDLAKALGLSQPAIWTWERGETKGRGNPGQPITPKADKLAAIAKALDVTIDELLGVRKRRAA
jgi:transcriptional regulator with XRE-family HTH domain